MKYTPFFKEHLLSFSFLMPLSNSVVLLLLGIFRPADAVLFGTVRQDYVLYGIGLFGIILSFTIIMRFYVDITDEMLKVRGIIFTNCIRWVDIKEVRHSHQRKGRIIDTHSYKLITLNGATNINFKFFPKECYNEVFKRVPVEIT